MIQLYIIYKLYIYRSGTTRLYPCVQVEDVKLSRKVLYHFANFEIINEILIFEDCRKRGMFGRPIGKCKRLARYVRTASLSARGVVYTAPLGSSERSHCRSKQLRARLATRDGCISLSVCICRWAGRTCLFSAIFKN